MIWKKAMIAHGYICYQKRIYVLRKPIQSIWVRRIRRRKAMLRNPVEPVGIGMPLGGKANCQGAVQCPF
jgi:hypothetical protein